MKTIKLEVELTYDEEMMHSGDGDEEAKDWFFNAVLGSEGLRLAELDEIGDEIGSVNVVKVVGGE